MNRTEQIFYFRTYTKYIVTIQYIYICNVWYMLHSDNSYACLRANNSVCIFFKENNKTHTHARTHTQHTRAHTHTLRILILNLTHSWEIVGGGTRIVCPLLCMALVKQATALRIWISFCSFKIEKCRCFIVSIVTPNSMFYTVCDANIVCPGCCYEKKPGG